jgi:tripartite ATP-independent transporter DctM subunit
MSTIILITFIVLLILLFLKVPVYISLLSASALYFLLNPSVNAQILAQKFLTGCENVSLLAIPFFIAAGSFMNYSTITTRIMDFCGVITGRMVGGLAQVNVLVSTFMGGLSGSNLADAAMDSKMLVPEMEKRGFSKEFSAVVTAVSSLITPMIPPGLALILYGTIAGLSIGRLFVSGFGIGVVMCLSQMVLVSIISKRRKYPRMRTTRVTGKEFFTALKKAALPLMLPLVMVGGIRFGVFTAIEAGAVMVIFALILGFGYKALNLKTIMKSLLETTVATASIMVIVGSATVFAWILTKERIPQMLAEMMVTITDNKYVFLMIINIFLLIVGMFVEGSAAMIVLVPLLAPMADLFGINPIHFAMVVIFNLSIGTITPPLGTVMFVVCSITKCPTSKFIKESIPFMILLLISLLLITYIPVLTTGLVDLVYG